MTLVQCKQWVRRTGARVHGRTVALAVGSSLAILLHACAAHPVRRTVTVRALETGRTVRPTTTSRVMMDGTRSLAELYRPLSQRFGFIQVRRSLDWQRLVRALPQLGPCPDLRRGTVIGLLSSAGLPLDGRWPIGFESVRLREGAGLVSAHFEGGNYLPDGTTFLELAYVEDLDAVLILDIDGVRFYPE